MDAIDFKSLPADTVSEDVNDSPTTVDLKAIPSANTLGSVVILDKTIQFATLHRPRPWYQRLDILPFLILYLVLIALAYPALAWEWETSSALALSTAATPEPLMSLVTNQTMDDDLFAASTSTDSVTSNNLVLSTAPSLIHFIAMFALPVIVIVHALTFLSSYWSVTVMSVIRYTRVEVIEFDSASHIRLVPALHCGSPAITLLESTVIDAVPTKCFIFQKTKFIQNKNFAGENERRPFFTPLVFPVSLPLSHYLSSQGLLSPAVVDGTLTKFGPNVFDIPLPSFLDLFTEHAMAPFFIFQVFCVLLWCLDEYWYYSLMTLFMLVSFECTVVQRRIKHLQFIRDMRVPPYQLLVYRNKQWQSLLTNQLLPGDLVSMTRTVGENVSPCDMLILTGTAVVNEALLTGESVPQVKDACDFSDPAVTLNINKFHKANILFGGTKLLTATNDCENVSDSNKLSVLSPPDNGCVCYVLKTGFYSSQGKLVRTILYSTERVSVNNTESLLFILFLLVFALVASGYVLVHGLEDESRSRYKLLLNCIMIITSVVPPELPMELSLAVNTSLMELAKYQIFCTEPFRIPLAGAINYCCFDKTGTLTSDTFYVEGIAGVSGGSDSGLVKAEDVNNDVKYVIAGCHSLTHIADTGLVGDPLEKAAISAIQWTVTKSDTAQSVKNASQRLKILHRFPFSSHLKRMSTVIALEHDSGSALRVVVKGAAEVLEPMFESLPGNYNACHSHFARQGARVLALGYRSLSLRDTPADRLRAKDLKRNDVERKLTFAGFLVLSCPIKPDSKDSVKHLIDSSHTVVMITGDNTLTACSVANQLYIVTRQCAILNHRHAENDLVWLDIDNKMIEPYSESDTALTSLDGRYDLCVSGEALEHLQKHHAPSSQLQSLILNVRVFARTSPDQKELILQQLKLAGKVCLMCGDGTNDVGALKQAHVGVALIGDDLMSEESRTKIKAREEKKAAAVAAGKKPQSQWQLMMNLSKQIQQEQAELERRTGKALSTGERTAMMKQRYEVEMKKMQTEFGMEEAPQIRLGDASIASPFTSKVPFINSCIAIIRQGRCTLVTTLQMFEILAINSLISAYSMSVLYLDGVKMGDTQMTVAGLSVAMFFLFISRSKPLDRLSSELPQSRLFTRHMMLSILGQFALHMVTLMTAVRLSLPHTPTDTETRSPDTTFKPNVLNTVVYLVSQVATTATFLANYRGRPFMQSLGENVWLWRALMASLGGMMFLASGVSTEINELMQLVEMPSATLRMQLVALLLFDVASTLLYSAMLRRVFRITPQSRQRSQQAGNGRLKAE